MENYNIHFNTFATSGDVQDALDAGTLVKPYVALIGEDEVDINGMEPSVSAMPLTFEILSAGTIEWTASSSLTKTIQYSLNGGDWTSITSTTAGTPINVSEGDVIKFRGYNSTYAESSRWNAFIGSAYFNAYGNIMSLIDGDNFRGLTAFTSDNAYAFRSLFMNTTQEGRVGSAAHILDASNLILPATTLAESCYWSMFQDTDLEVPPVVLPATTLAHDCYRSMFCRSKVTTSPELPATTLAESCYRNMFYECKTIITAPELPATTLAPSCYYYMFVGCTALTTAPELPATALTDYCYQAMFSGCTSLTKVTTELPATTLTNTCYKEMFRGCTSLVKGPDILVETFPNQGAAAQGCCYYMFHGCTSLNYIKCMATNLGSTYTNYNIYYWVANVSTTGTFVKKSGAFWPNGPSGIPTNWTVTEV